ncbi:MAG: FeoB-associated Cys-rich membrane protein [Ruminococcaceae bacterium]|nr:FeoB-associated Cys-rich membrane protein [Oscillospiraceae bacterium]
MNTIDYFLIALIAGILGAVIWYLHRAKKRGVKCIGCPDGAKCSGHCAGCSGGCSHKQEN